MATPAPKLYLLPGSSSMFPHILMRYCELHFTPVPVSLSIVYGDSYLNSKKQVPTLALDDETIITENPAIALAISQLAPDKHILGRTPLEHVRVSEWMAWIAGPVHAQAWGPYIRPFRFTDDESAEALAAVKQAARRKCEERFATLEEGLHPTGPWALGQNFTAVDAYIFPFYRLATSLMKLDTKELFPKWTRITDNLLKLECVKETLQFEEDARQKLS